MQVAWKALYQQSSGDYGTLAFFRNRLGRTAVTADVKKDVNATLDLLETVLKGHWLASACLELGLQNLDDSIPKATELLHASAPRKQAYIEDLARKVVDRMTLVDSAFLGCGTADTKDRVYNYACVLCHFGSLVAEFRDA